jgi:putative transposase
VLAWRLSNTMDSSFCIAAPQEALPRFGTPDIFNTNRGSQFSSADFTGVLMAAGMRISMDGRGRWMDNAFFERLWGSLKYEDIYLARSSIVAWFVFYNTGRPHQALGQRTPMAVWRQGGTGGFANTAVDTTLRLDDARASPTCPQPRQQHQLRVA